MAEEEVARLKQELAEATSSFDELSSSSAQIEKELNEEIETQGKAMQTMRQEAQELREKVAEQSRRLAVALAAGEAAREELRECQTAMAQLVHVRVELETQVAQLSAAVRAGEAGAERYKTKYEELLEHSTMEKCQLEEARRELAELKERRKVEDGEGEGDGGPGKAMSAAERKEAALVRTLLKELVAALSRGNVVIPTADELIRRSGGSVASAASGSDRN